MDLASALAEANAWMATSRGGPRGGSAGDAAELATNAVAADASAAEGLHGDSGAAAGSGPREGELQSAPSMIVEEEAKEGGPVPRLQPRQLTLGGAPRKASDAQVLRI